METPAFRATSFNVTIGYPFLCVLRCNCCIAAIHYNEDPEENRIVAINFCNF